MSSRRDFLRSTSGVVAACASGTVLATLLESCTPVKFISVSDINGLLSVSKSELLQQSFVVLKTSSLAFPVYLTRIADVSPRKEENYSALLMSCTHKQCEVKPAGNILHCPCHGSEFSATGVVLKEPASANLHKFKVTHDEKTIYIHLK